MANSTFLATDPDGYERNMGRWSRRLAPEFLRFADCPRAIRVLDVGCGTGHLAMAVAAAAAAQEIRGIDLAEPYIDRARRTAADPRLRFEVGDACAIDAPDASFDAVLSLLVLHFVPQPQRAIAEMRRVARPGAVVAAAVWDARGGFVANRLFFDTAAALDPRAGERRARNYTRPLTRPGELGQAWRQAGMAEVTQACLCSRMEFTCFEDYWEPYEGQDGPGAEYVRSLDASARGQLRDAVAAAYLDGEADGPRSYAALAWAVRGVAPGRLEP